MIFLVGHQKGGCGKSTTATNLAVALAHQDKDVLLVDGDLQPTSSTWWSYRKADYPKHPKIACVIKHGDLDETLLDLDERYEHVIVDVTGRFESIEMRSAMTVCHIALLPFRPSGADIDTAGNMNALVRNSKFINPQMKALAFLNMSPTNSRIEEAQSRSTLSEYNHLILLETSLRDRKVYRDALSEGLGVIEIDCKTDSEVNSKKEFLAFVDEVLKYGN